MTDLAAQLRALTDSAAEPIGLEEVTTRSTPERSSPPPGPLEGRSRSSRTALVAAMVIFIAGLAGLVWFVADRSDPAAPTASGTGALYALPPADAAELQVIYPKDPPFEDRGAFLYDDPVLGPVQLHTGSSSASGFTDPQSDLQKAQDLGFDALTTDVAGFGTVTVICMPPNGPGTTVTGDVTVAVEGQALIRWYGDGISTTLFQNESGTGTCTASDRAPALEQAMTNVRLVTHEEWERFIEENRTQEVPDTTTVTTKPGPAGWCDAVEALRSSGTIDASSGAIRTDALPYLRDMLSESPAEVAPPIQTLITWLEQGAPTPAPAEVTAAESTSTLDWATRCPAG